MKKHIAIALALLMMACQQEAPVDSTIAAVETPAISKTIWTNETELFVEFPVLTVGKTSRFAAHFTVLDGHQPVRDGSVTVSLVKGRSGIRHTVEAPSSPGIFSPALQPKEAGIYQLIFDLKTSSYSDRIVIDNVNVYSSLDEAVETLSGVEAEDGISFLKEQAWKMEFHTAPVRQKEIYQVISTSGIWKVAASDDQILVAPASGKLKFKPRYLTEGRFVKKGELLMEVTSEEFTTDNFQAEIQKAKASFDRAKTKFDRIKLLYQDKIVPKSDFEMAEEDYLLAKTNYETLNQGFTGRGKQVTAPFDGYIISIDAENGELATQGTALMTITRDEHHVLQTRVSTSHALALNEVHDLWYQRGNGSWSSLKANGGQVISVSREVTPDAPMLSIFSQVEETIHMPDGSFTEVQVAVGEASSATVVPSSALLEDYGQYSVIVQLSGETFEKRDITIGRKNGSEVEVKNGLRAGEVVVTKGAYHVKMASMSGAAPAHGHAH